jgi:hypothetical protein
MAIKNSRLRLEALKFQAKNQKLLKIFHDKNLLLNALLPSLDAQLLIVGNLLHKYSNCGTAVMVSLELIGVLFKPINIA